MSWRSRIARVSPGELMVTAHGQARVRVEGTVYGSIRVGKERRWAWGIFDETFVVRPLGDRRLEVVLSGLGGRDRVQVEGRALINLQAPQVVANFPVVTSRVRLPRARGLMARRILAPRVVHLARAPIQLAPPESASPATQPLETQPKS